MLEAFESSSASDRLRAAAAFLAQIPAATEVLIVGASRTAADELARQVTVARGVTFGLHRASFMQLAARLAATEMAERGVAPATALGVEAVAAPFWISRTTGSRSTSSSRSCRSSTATCGWSSVRRRRRLRLT